MLVSGKRRLLTALLQAQKWPFQPSRDMRLVQFRAPHLVGPHLGLETGNGGGVINLNAFDPTLPKTMTQFLDGQHHPEAAALVPLHPPRSGKQHQQIMGPEATAAHYSSPTLQEVDWEVELAVVMGKKGKHIKATDAMAHVAGFTVAHDVSARDWLTRRNGKQWLLGKTFDTFCPLGPALVTKDSVADPHNLKICCRVNGEVVQSSNTNQMVFKTEDLIAWVSQFVTFYPGDVILTGTPPGVGVFRKPPVFLKKGDEVQCEIEELGVIINKVV
uniref:Fumarylacetoacetase-like C-terminal domain-containing protein n=1 Tax=Gorilla gorilla gorilla TaxID=9595 RepID=G3RM02_GORGO